MSNKGYIISDNDGYLPPSVTPHAGCYISTPASTTITSAGTYYLLAGTSTALALSGFTHSSPGRLTYTGTITQTFKIESKFSITADHNNILIEARIAVNGTTNVSSEQENSHTTGANTAGVNCGSFISLSTNDYVETYVTCDSAGTVLTASEAVLMITSI
jgi:hypothetical protein